MEGIDNLFNEIRDAGEFYARYKSFLDKKAGLEKELDRIEEEIKRVDSMSLEREIKKTTNEYQGVLENIERLSLNSKECKTIEDLEVVFSKVSDTDVLMKKSLEFLKHSAILKCIDPACEEVAKEQESENGDGLIRFEISKDIENLFQLSAKYTKIQERCYLSFRLIICESIQGAIPADIKVFQDDRSLFFVHKDNDGEPSFHMLEEKVVVDLKEISRYKMMSHAIFGVLRDNLRKKVVEKNLTDEEVERNNLFFKDTEFYIHNVPEWKLDIVMKEIIEVTKGPRSMEAVETFETSDRMPKSVSASYKRFQGCFEMFRRLRSKRHEKGVKVINRAITKLFDPKRHEPSVYSYFLEFADITHFLRTYPGHPLTDELSKRKEELFFDVVKESSRVNVELVEPLVTLKLYFKEKHVEFSENMRLFVPVINRNLFEIQFFEMLDEGLMERIRGLKIAKRSTVENIILLIDYIFDLSFHLPTEAIGNQEKLRSYKQVLSLDRERLIKEYRDGKLCISDEEFVSLCSLAFREPEDKIFLLSKMSD
ncbi:hypothetical protein EROM_110340 [Encephalitozoon romaleae SJ-2008]|uniref:Uncharacterized protein n=1 Tax=Encephalitozoon romaleae (strain SJ-2008) TaxID=1178016 RepID=I6ZW77_ENCRO|nr:hypothetical protein EROM_110340 [Encephalitozoon romaleae SJ-2008]AFN84016.1 hypothetical protein EROM_110340 [Encephalitozoon romaleae SJ-2008]